MEALVGSIVAEPLPCVALAAAERSRCMVAAGLQSMAGAERSFEAHMAAGPLRCGRAVVARGPHRVGSRYGGGVWYGTGRRYWGGRWYAYGVGSCWRWTDIGYVWICR